MRSRTLSTLAAIAAAPAPVTIIGVDVPAELRMHFDRALEIVGRMGQDIVGTRDVFASPISEDETFVTLVERNELYRLLAENGERAAAALVKGAPPGGRTRIVLQGDDGQLRVYAFRWLDLAPGGDA